MSQRTLLRSLLVLNAFSALAFSLLLIAGFVFVIGAVITGEEEPEDIVGWILVGAFAAAMAWLCGTTTASLRGRLRDGKVVSRGPAIRGAVLAGLALFAVLAGVALGSGGVVIGLLLAIIFAGLVLAAVHLRPKA